MRSQTGNMKSPWQHESWRADISGGGRIDLSREGKIKVLFQIRATKKKTGKMSPVYIGKTINSVQFKVVELHIMLTGPLFRPGLYSLRLLQPNFRHADVSSGVCWWSRTNETLVWATKSSGIKISERHQNKTEAYVRDDSSSTIKYSFKCFSCTFIRLSSAQQKKTPSDVTWNQKSVVFF